MVSTARVVPSLTERANYGDPLATGDTTQCKEPGDPRKGGTVRKLGVMSLVVLVLALTVSSAAIASDGPLNALSRICAHQGGTWHPDADLDAFPGPTPECSLREPYILFQGDDATFGQSQLQAVESLCNAAGYAGRATGGKGVVTPDGRVGAVVAAWWCRHPPVVTGS